MQAKGDAMIPKAINAAPYHSMEGRIRRFLELPDGLLTVESYTGRALTKCTNLSTSDLREIFSDYFRLKYPSENCATAPNSPPNLTE